MSEPTTFRIVLRGRASPRLLRPLIDDFAISYTVSHNSVSHDTDHAVGDTAVGDTASCTTSLVGEIRDPSHLHGVLAHLTSVNAEIISVAPQSPASTAPISTDPISPDPKSPIP
jgi:hypothetical protein